MSDPAPSPSEVRLHVVSGKGGTGKTTVAAAFALALARNGKQVLLCEVEGRQGIAQVFDVAPLPYEERSVAVAPGGGEVFALAIDPEAGFVVVAGNYSFAFDKNNELIQPLTGEGQLIDVCEALA